jgi:hypothetical protein
MLEFLETSAISISLLQGNPKVSNIFSLQTTTCISGISFINSLRHDSAKINSQSFADAQIPGDIRLRVDCNFHFITRYSYNPNNLCKHFVISGTFFNFASDEAAEIELSCA